MSNGVNVSENENNSNNINAYQPSANVMAKRRRKLINGMYY